ncbi:MAG: hypothetical protein KAS39_08830, partial [Actinomycetia bacterium]|nr:hypothetical protein [Actinomycetes bacterium]
IIFSNGDMFISGNENEYNTIFGKSNIEISGSKKDLAGKKVEVNCIFGNSTLYINSDIPMKLKISAAFAGAKLPNDSILSFGDSVYKTSSYSKDKKEEALLIKASVVFGGLQIVERKKTSKTDK